MGLLEKAGIAFNTLSPHEMTSRGGGLLEKILDLQSLKKKFRQTP